MQHGIGKDRVKLGAEVELACIAGANIQASFPRGVEHAGAVVDPQHRRSSRYNPLSQRSVATAEIEDAFTRLWREPIENPARQFGHESRVMIVALSAPWIGFSHGGFSLIGCSDDRRSLHPAIPDARPHSHPWPAVWTQGSRCCPAVGRPWVFRLDWADGAVANGGFDSFARLAAHQPCSAASHAIPAAPETPRQFLCI